MFKFLKTCVSFTVLLLVFIAFLFLFAFVLEGALTGYA